MPTRITLTFVTLESSIMSDNEKTVEQIISESVGSSDFIQANKDNVVPDDDTAGEQIISDVEEPNFEEEDKDSVAGEKPLKGKMFLVGFLISSISLPIVAWIWIALSDGSDRVLALLLPISILIFVFWGGFLLKKDIKNI